MPKKHTISCSADVKIHDLKSVVSPVNLLYKGSVGKGSNNYSLFCKNSTQFDIAMKFQNSLCNITIKEALCGYIRN